MLYRMGSGEKCNPRPRKMVAGYVPRPQEKDDGTYPTEERGWAGEFTRGDAENTKCGVECTIQHRLTKFQSE